MSRRKSWAAAIESQLAHEEMSEATAGAASWLASWLEDEITPLPEIVVKMQKEIDKLDVLIEADNRHVELATSDYSLGNISHEAVDLAITAFYAHEDLKIEMVRYKDILEYLIRVYGEE